MLSSPFKNSCVDARSKTTFSLAKSVPMSSSRSFKRWRRWCVASRISRASIQSWYARPRKRKSSNWLPMSWRMCKQRYSPRHSTTCPRNWFVSAKWIVSWSLKPWQKWSDASARRVSWDAVKRRRNSARNRNKFSPRLHVPLMTPLIPISIKSLTRQPIVWLTDRHCRRFTIRPRTRLTKERHNANWNALQLEEWMPHHKPTTTKSKTLSHHSSFLKSRGARCNTRWKWSKRSISNLFMRRFWMYCERWLTMWIRKMMKMLLKSRSKIEESLNHDSQGF
mmetsp:Transcript_9785/g.36515  ORF Transcript_9785/g.36515 Transcript_9785/m.36515 type:complete len:279 (-) Transcript_9785:61-897(-)